MKHVTLRRTMIFVFIFLILIITPVMAHPPSDIILSYEPSTSELNVTIVHKVKDSAAHYINMVNISVGGLGVLEERYASQPTNDTFTYMYLLNASEGSTISVLGVCNLGGDLTHTLVVGEVITQPTTATLTTTPESPAFTLWASIIGLLIVACIFSIRQ